MIKIFNDDYGNYNYGYAAYYFDISLEMAIEMAGLYQIYSGTADWHNTAGWFDDARDTEMIIEGYYRGFLGY